jgi:hypothetical protein
MPDLDDLLRSDVAGTASRSVDPPPLATVVTRGRRLRTRRRAQVAAACVLVALAAGGGFLGRGALQTSPLPAAPQPAPHQVHHTPAPERGPTAEQVVDAADASVTQVAVSDDPDVRAVLWQQCERRCHTRHAAIALTTDGFASRTLVRVRAGAYPYLAPAGQNAFLVTNDGPHPYLLDTDGTRRAIAAPGPVAPVRDNEVVTFWDRETHVAVDPTSGVAHHVNAPAGVAELLNEGSGRLVSIDAMSAVPSVVWSDDGGATWREHSLSAKGRFLYQLVPSAAPGTTAVLVGSDGATIFPFEAVQRGARDGASWQGFEQGSPPAAYVEGGVVLPDGRLLVCLEQVHETFRPGTGSEPRMGLYVSAGDDWSSFARLDPPDGAPGLAPGDVPWLHGADLTLAGVSATPGRATAYVTEHGGNRVFSVVDGRTWTEVRAR